MIFMIELLYTSGIVAGLLAFALTAALVPWNLLLEIGGILTAAGFAACLPISFGYHFALYRNLKPSGLLPKRWWLSPSACHDSLAPGPRSRVLLWYYSGIVAVTICMLGCAILLIATAMAWRGA